LLQLQKKQPIKENPIGTVPTSRAHLSFDQNTFNHIVGNHANRRTTAPTMLTSPTAVTFIQEQLVSFFVSFFAKSAANQVKPYGWMTLLPLMLSDRSRLELRSSVLAAALVLHGELSQDLCCEIEARKWYGYALKHQRMKVLQAFRSSEKITPGMEDITAAVMLAYYEVISSTSGIAYFQHILGAKALLDTLGPQNCQWGYFYQLFQTVRLHMVCVLSSGVFYCRPRI
jgi:hypothetical protein